MSKKARQDGDCETTAPVGKILKQFEGYLLTAVGALFTTRITEAFAIRVLCFIIKDQSCRAIHAMIWREFGKGIPDPVSLLLFDVFIDISAGIYKTVLKRHPKAKPIVALLGLLVEFRESVHRTPQTGLSKAKRKSFIQERRKAVERYGKEVQAAYDTVEKYLSSNCAYLNFSEWMRVLVTMLTKIRERYDETTKLLHAIQETVKATDEKLGHLAPVVETTAEVSVRTEAGVEYLKRKGRHRSAFDEGVKERCHSLWLIAKAKPSIRQNGNRKVTHEDGFVYFRSELALIGIKTLEAFVRALGAYSDQKHNASAKERSRM